MSSKLQRLFWNVGRSRSCIYDASSLHSKDEALRREAAVTFTRLTHEAVPLRHSSTFQLITYLGSCPKSGIRETRNDALPMSDTLFQHMTESFLGINA